MKLLQAHLELHVAAECLCTVATARKYLEAAHWHVPAALVALRGSPDYRNALVAYAQGFWFSAKPAMFVQDDFGNAVPVSLPMLDSALLAQGSW